MRCARSPEYRTVRFGPARRDDANTGRLRRIGQHKVERPAPSYPGGHDLGADRDQQRRTLYRDGGRRLPSQALRAGTARSADPCLPRQEAAARPGSGPSGNHQAPAETSGRPAARYPARRGGERADEHRPGQAAAFYDVAVLFIDLVGFTAWCHSKGPEDVVAEVQRLAEAFEIVAHNTAWRKSRRSATPSWQPPICYRPYRSGDRGHPLRAGHGVHRW